MSVCHRTLTSAAPAVIVGNKGKKRVNRRGMNHKKEKIEIFLNGNRNKGKDDKDHQSTEVLMNEY